MSQQRKNAMTIEFDKNKELRFQLWLKQAKALADMHEIPLNGMINLLFFVDPDNDYRNLCQNGDACVFAMMRIFHRPNE